MPIIYRPPKLEAKDPQNDWSKKSLKNVPLDWDENRKEADDVLGDSKSGALGSAIRVRGPNRFAERLYQQSAPS